MRVWMPLAIFAAWGMVTSGAQDRPQFRARVDVVSVDDSVRDGGRVVAGLGAIDFEVVDNGIAQQIDSLTIENLPIDATLVIEVSNEVITNDRTRTLRTDLQRVAELLGPADHLRVLADGTYVTEAVPDRPGTAPLPVEALPSGGGSAPGDALTLALMRPAVQGRRQLVVLFTLGTAYYTVLDDDTVIAVARRSDALLHLVGGPIWTGGSVNRGRLVDSPHLIPLRAAAEATGGAAHDSGRGLAAAFKDIIDDFRASYLLRYTPRGVQKTGWHDISVRVTKPGSSKFAVRARRGYVSG